MAIEDPVFESSKEFLAVSSIANEIKSSIHSYLLAASPHSDMGSQPVTPAVCACHHVVLSPWNGCVGASLESCSPLPLSPSADCTLTTQTPCEVVQNRRHGCSVPSSDRCLDSPVCVTPRVTFASSLESDPLAAVPQPTAVTCPQHRCYSPTRNRFHSPKAAAAPGAGTVFETKSISHLEDAVTWTSSSLGPIPKASLPPMADSCYESKLDLDDMGLSWGQSIFASATRPVSENLRTYSEFKGKKPPRPPSRKQSAKFDVVSGIRRGRIRGLDSHDGNDQLVTSFVSALLILLFFILVVYGSPAK